MARSLAILGAGGHGRVVADCAAAMGWDAIVFFDDTVAVGTKSGPWAVVGSSAELLERAAEMDAVFVGIGNNRARLDWHTKLIALGAHSTNLIHPRASVSPYSTLGTGILIAAGAVVGIGAQIGDAAIVNTGSTVDHDCTLLDGAHVSPGANLAGGVQVGKRSWIGIGAVARENIVIGSDCVVGAGAVVVSQIEDGLTVIGNPARATSKGNNA